MNERIRAGFVRRGRALIATAIASGLPLVVPAVAQAQKGVVKSPEGVTIVGLDSAAAAALFACRRIQAYGQHAAARTLKSWRERGVLVSESDSMIEESRLKEYDDVIASRFGLGTLPDSIRSILPQAPRCGVVPRPTPLRQLIRAELNQLPRLGVGIEALNGQTAAARGIADTAGLFVSSVTPNMGAQRAGILVGDVILAIDGHSVTTIRDLRTVSEAWKNGSKVKVAISRKGVRQEIAVEAKVPS